jgi:CheY-like chemotaxis protein
VALTVRWAPDEEGGGEALFRVADTGIGISADALPTLFEAFTQADSSTTRVYGGTGLGLAISHRLVDAMGGEIQVDSEVGVGSTFSVRIPLPTAALTGIPESQHDVLADLPVLVVDDNATNRLVLESQLVAWGARATALADPETVVPAMRAAAEAGRPYAVVVLDMCMPGMTGLQLAHLISSDRVLGGARMMMLTSGGQVQATDPAEAGVEEWLNKPVSTSDLYDRLVRMMTRSQKLTQRPEPEAHGTMVSLGRVLVVEDNALNQMVAEAMVTKLGYQVDLVANGEEALHAISAVEYSAVLMDCHMPVMDGFTATVEIRDRQGSQSRVPIIAMTAGAMTEDRDKCLAVGMDDYVSKPVKAEVLAGVLEKWIAAPSTVSS